MKTYLIIYDNGESYEDHDRYPILAAKTEKRAKEVMTKMNAWIKRAKAKCPEVPDFESPDYEAQEAKRESYVKSLKPPFGISELVGIATDQYSHYQNLHIREIRVV